VGTDDLSDELRSLITELRDVIRELRAANAAKDARIEDLERRLSRDSSNSSKPPSTDGPWSKRRQRRRPPSAKKQGAQPGHQGKTRTPIESGDVDEIIDHEPEKCTRCGHDELLLIGAPRRHQVVEIPQVVATVTEHRMHRACCAACGEEVVASHPHGVPQSNFGPRLHAMAASLLANYRLTRREVSRFFNEVCDVEVSVGSVSNMERRVSNALAAPFDDALRAVQSSEVLHVDETPWKQRGVLHWLWTAVGKDFTVHRVDRRRNREAMRALIGERFAGLLVTDRLATYDEIPASRRQVCWAHLERDFRGLTQGPASCRRFGETGLELAQAILRCVRHHKEHRDQERLQRELEPHFGRLIDLLVDGAASDVRGVSGFAINLLKRIESLWLFADHPDVSPTNNIAERAIRKAVLWRKSCFGSQSERGLRFAERMLTVIATKRRRGEGVLDYLVEVVRAAIRGEAVPMLIPHA
jgi:transposase